MKCKTCEKSFTGSATRRITHIAGGEFANSAQVSACTNPDKTLKMELISRIQEEKGRKRLKHQTSQALTSLTLSSSVPFPDTNSISSTNQSFIVDYSKKKVNF